MLLDLNNMVEKYDLDIGGVLHIGAHHGQEVEEYKRLGISKIAMVEPQPECQRILEDKFGSDESICLFKCAVGSKDTLGTTTTMYTETANTGQSSSLLKPVLHLSQYPHIQFTGTIEVELSTVDHLMQGLDSPESYNFINMDVQGYELEVLKGSTEHLKNVDYVMTEVNRAEVYEDCAMVRELDTFLQDFGMTRVETDWAGMLWGDALYVRTER
jgi:FkbM family methyltransferase